MELQHLPAAGLLVQAIDVLGDDGLELALPLPLGQLFVGGVGLGVQGQHLGPVEVVKFLHVALVKAVTEHGLRRVFEFLMVQAVHAAEVLDAGFRADPGPAEEDDVVALVHQLFQLHNGFSHGMFLHFSIV